MVPQTVFPTRPEVATSPHDGFFWPLVLLGLPAANLALISPVAFLAGQIFVPVAVLVALVEIPLLSIWSKRRANGTLATLAAVVGDVVVTVLGFAVVFMIAFSIMCEGACLS